MSYVGNLRQYHLSDVLHLIGSGQRRGRLVVERGGLRAHLYCEAGYLLHVWREGSTPPLINQWIGSGLLSQEHLPVLASRFQADPATIPDSVLAQFCVENGIISPEMVTEWAMRDAISLLTILFSWRDGDYRFEEGLSPSVHRLRVTLPILSVLSRVLEQGAVAMPPNPSSIQVQPTDVLDFVDVDPADPRPIHITAEQWRILARLDGESSLLQIAESLALANENETDTDPLRHQAELKTATERVLRIARDLIAEDIATIRAN
jgi:hypothetical protein